MAGRLMAGNGAGIGIGASGVAGTDASMDASTGAGTVASGVGPDRVEIVTRCGRRGYSAEDKARLVDETLRPGVTVAWVSRRYGICASLLYRWRRALRGEAAKERRERPRLLPVRLVVPDAAVPRSEVEAVAGIASAPIEVVLRNGRVLRVMTTTDAAVVARLAAVLEA